MPSITVSPRRLPSESDWYREVPLDLDKGMIKPNPVVDGIPQPLFAAHIPFGRLDADVAK